jgi:ABC-type sulfate transport system substrate-binding protein
LFKYNSIIEAIIEENTFVIVLIENSGNLYGVHKLKDMLFPDIRIITANPWLTKAIKP